MSAAGPARVHPAADTLPLLEGDELAALAGDIREYGLLEPVTTWRGVVVDGRNRLRACEAAGVEPRFEEREFDSDAAVFRFVLSKNLRRRHLNETQRGMVAVAGLPFFEAKASAEAARVDGAETAP